MLDYAKHYSELKYKQFYHQLKHEGHIPQVVISAAKLPTLFIHGSKDKFVTIDYLEDVYNSYGGKKGKTYCR